MLLQNYSVCIQILILLLTKIRVTRFSAVFLAYSHEQST